MENKSHTTLNVCELRRLKRSVAYPDNFTKQNVSDAKQSFVEDTISYLCQWLADKMACPDNFFDKVMKEYADQNGYVAEILEDKVELLKSRIEKMPGSDPKKYVFLNEISFLKYATVIHYIFIARLMNKHARLIVGEEKRSYDSSSGKATVILSLNVDKEIERMET